MEQDETNTKQNNQEKEKFFKNLNSFLIKSGLIAGMLKTFKTNITQQVEEVRNDAQKRIIVGITTFLGGILVVYGIVEILMAHFGMTLYTNLATGGVLLFIALLVQAFRD